MAPRRANIPFAALTVSIAASTLGLNGCGIVLGLEDLKDRPADAAVTEEAAEADSGHGSETGSDDATANDADETSVAPRGDAAVARDAPSPCDSSSCACVDDGSAGTAACCTNTCTAALAKCASATTVQSCELQPNGCTSMVSQDCSAQQGTAGEAYVCERNVPVACADPAWAEWPMPNSSVDVTNGAPNADSYTNNGDGTVTDNVTGLMWQRSNPSAPYTQADGESYCNGLDLGGHDDWRLPSIVELVSIVDYTQYQPSINGIAFPSTPPQPFVTATPDASATASFGSPACAIWVVGFAGGTTGCGSPSDTNYVRCVR